MSQETITIHVTAPAAGPKQLNYTGTAGLSVTPKGGSVKAKQKIDIGDDVAWTCSDGGFVIQFLGATSPFTDGTMQLMGSSGAATPFKTTTKKKSRKKPFEYVVSVSQPGTQPPIMEDPDLDIFDGGGGGGPKTKKKGSPAKAKKYGPKKYGPKKKR